MRCLITGVTGFIGRHVLREVLHSGKCEAVIGLSNSVGHGYYEWVPPKPWEILTWKCDLRREHDVRDALKIARPDIIFHLAANPIVKENDKDPTAITKLNVLGTHNLLANFTGRFVYTSSATVYGPNIHGTKFNEEFHMPKPTSVYAATKLAGESLVGAISSSPLILRLVANVGEGATHGVLPDVIRKLRSPNPKLELLGDNPGSCKPYSYVKDTAAFIVKLGLSQETGIVNVGPNDNITIHELAYQVMYELGIEKPIEWLGESANWAGDNRVVRIDNSKARLLGYRPVSSYEAIIKGINSLLGANL